MNIPSLVDTIIMWAIVIVYTVDMVYELWLKNKPNGTRVDRNIYLSQLLVIVLSLRILHVL